MSNLLTGLKSDVRLDSEEAHYARLVEQYRELEAKVERLREERNYWRALTADLVDGGRMEQMLAVLPEKEGKQE